MLNRLFARRIVRYLVGVCLALLVTVSFLYFRQHSMVYHPRPYDESYAYALPGDGEEINYTDSATKYCAYYLPGGGKPLPKRIWLAFCGNGSLALDWTTILRDYPWNGDAFLLIDYPGYGKNEGYASITSTRASVDAAVKALTEKLRTDENLKLCAIGHSLGAAVALDFAARHRVERIVLISPFTTLREEAATIFGGWIARLLIENYDNRANLVGAVKRNPNVRVAIFHGTNDEVIPVRMGRELAQEFPFIEFFPVENADHVSVLNHGHDKIIEWMNGASGTSDMNRSEPDRN
jgi:pimeloyl-ACP methyl ester carboxylesterase